MKKIFFLFLLIVPLLLVAQQKITLQGATIDSKSKEAIPFVTVSIIKGDKFITGSISDKDGNFKLFVQEPDTYYINLTYMGYRSVSKQIVTQKGQTLKLGEIFMEIDSEELDEVIVKGHKNLREESLEAKVYKVSDNLSAKGSSVAEFMQTVPGISVDMEGTIKLRGSEKIGFYVDNKPSAMLGPNRTANLQQIPASSIERIEVITNPSAKYDPDGMAGIINIVFKEGMHEGLNGEAKFTYGYDDIYMPSVNLNYRKKNLNVFGSFDGVWKEYQNHNEEYERVSNAGSDIQTQKYVTKEPFNYQIYRIGAEYSFGRYNNNQLTVYTRYMDEYEENIGNVVYNSLDANREFLSGKKRNLFETEKNDVIDAALQYKHQFAQKKRELSSGIIYSSARERENYFFNEDSINAVGNSLGANGVDEKTELDNFNSTWNIYLDFSQQFRENGKIEVGYKSIIRKIDLEHKWFNSSADTLQDVIGRRDYLYTYKEQIHSFYALVKDRIQKFNYELGVRAEQVLTYSEEEITTFDFTNNYFLFYPSLKTGYSFKNNHSVLLSYSARVNRPEFEDLNIVPKFVDPLNLYVGNYDLEPEYVHSVEAGYEKEWKRMQFLLNGFYRYINNPVYQIVEFDADGTGTYFPENFNYAANTGGEIIGNFEIFNWWILNGSFTIYSESIGESVNIGTNKNDTLSYNTKLSSLFMFKNGFKFQLNGWYTAPTINPLGTLSEQYALNITADQTIFNGRGNIFIRITDVLNTLEKRISYKTTTYQLKRIDDHETRFFYFGFKYKFNL